MNSLGPSISQGEVFRKQQEKRILTNSNVVTGNANRNKNSGNKRKNGSKASKNSEKVIEPFVQNINSDYKTLTMQDIDTDNAGIKSVNDRQLLDTKNSISSYNVITNNLNTFQQGVTDEANAYNSINKNTGTLNKNYLTADGKTIRVNNKGVVNTLEPRSLKAPLTPDAGLNISSSTANSIPEVNYIPIQNIPEGLTKGSDTGLYNPQVSSKVVSLPADISGYNLEGENVFVVYPYPNDVASINKNMNYIGAFTNNGVQGLTLDRLMPTETTLNCLQRAVDQGYSWCGMINYGWSDNSQGGGGKCMIGNVTNISEYAYDVRNATQSSWYSTLKFPPGYTALTFGADGVLYGGFDFYKFGYPLTKVFSSDLDPTYGATINNLVGSYAYNQGRWQNLTSFSGNYDPTGQPSGSFNTLYQYNIQVPNIGYYTHYYYDWFGQLQSYQAPYVYYTTQTAQELAAPNTEYGNLTYINYNCGKNPTKEPINVGGQNAGAGYNISCTDLYNKYPSFTLELSDAGILKITNNTSSAEVSADAKVATYDMSFGFPKKIKLSGGQEVTLNMPRYDWVSGSKNKGQTLTSSSRNIHTINNGEWISSPNGFCRLVLSNSTLYLEYSLQDVSQDKDGNLVGNKSSIALYNIRNANSLNLGKSAHIDINGAVNPYTTQNFDNVYTEIKGYLPTYIDPKNTATNYSKSQCENACNNNNSCYGYIYGNSACNIITTSTQIFGNNTINKIPASPYNIYARNPSFPNNDKSCRKTLDAVIGTDAYSYYLNNGITTNPPTNMTPQTKCNLGKVLDNQMTELKRRNDQSIQKGNEIKNKFYDLFVRENKILNNITENKNNAETYDKNTKNIEKEIERIKNQQITKSASEQDSELLLVSDNYRYIILGIVSLLISLATIKGLRMASS
jgi:hypothetical protein